MLDFEGFSKVDRLVVGGRPDRPLTEHSRGALSALLSRDYKKCTQGDVGCIENCKDSMESVDSHNNRFNCIEY